MIFNRTYKLPFSLKKWRQSHNLTESGGWRRSTRFNELQRIRTNWDKSERIQYASLRMCTDRCDSLWRHNSFEHFKIFVAPPRTLATSATETSNIFCRTRTNCNELQRPWRFFFWGGGGCHESRFVAIRRKQSWQCDLGLNLYENWLPLLSRYKVFL